MIHLFIDVWPEDSHVRHSEFTPEYVKKLVLFTEVATNLSFDNDDVVDLLVLEAANRLLTSLHDHGVQCRVGVTYDFSHNYPGWTLLVDTDYTGGTINPLVSKFFRWGRTESQDLLSFNELMEI